MKSHYWVIINDKGEFLCDSQVSPPQFAAFLQIAWIFEDEAFAINRHNTLGGWGYGPLKILKINFEEVKVS